MDAVGADREGDVDPVVDDELRVVPDRQFAQRKGGVVVEFAGSKGPFPAAGQRSPPPWRASSTTDGKFPAAGCRFLSVIR